MWETVETGSLMEDIVVQREGSSQRTVEELLRVFIADCAEVTGEQRFETLLAEFDEAYAKDNGGYEALCFENLSAIADDAEAWLVDAGYVVDWNDGYIIFEA